MPTLPPPASALPVASRRHPGGGLDAHVHVWDRATDPQPWIDPATMAPIDRDVTMSELAAMLDAVGVGSAIVVQSSNSLDETRRLLASATDRVAGVVGWLDLTGDVVGQLSTLPTDLRSRLVGVRHLTHIDPDPRWLGRGDVGRGVAAAGRAGLCVDLVVRWRQLPLVETVVRAHPEVRFVLDHLGNPPEGAGERYGWARSLSALAAHDRVVAKLSGVVGTLGRDGWTVDDCRPIVDVAVEVFGPDRLMYGSDWPLVELAGGPRRWHEAVTTLVARLTASERAAILGDTAHRVYGLEAA